MNAWPPLDGGELRDSVTIQAPVFTPDGGGGRKASWNDVATVRAEVVPISGGETFVHSLTQRTQFYRIRIRYRAGITPANRLLLNGAPLNIRSAEDPNRDREQLMIMAESGVLDG